MLYELTRHFKTEELCVVHGINDPPIESDQILPFKRKQVLFFGSGINTLRLNRYFPKLYMVLIRLEIRKAIRRENPDCLYIHYPNGAFSSAAYLEAKRAKLPYVFYQDILWEERESGAELDLAREYEAAVIQDAKTCVAITEFAAEHQSKKHGKEFITIPHTLDADEVPTSIDERMNDVPVIHFAGGIYPQMNQDSVERLIEAVKKTGRKVEFEFCSPDVPASLANEPINWKYLSKSDLLNAQRSADILFLPQAFSSKSGQMITHNFPTKTMEYLCSGTPILVHSPSNSYLSDLCRNEGFGVLVEEPDVDQLASAIIKLLDSEELRRTSVERAIALAHKRDSRHWYKVLHKLLSDAVTGN